MYATYNFTTCANFTKCEICNIGMKYVKYWYQFFMRCEELVPIFHSVKFAKCEICGSTKLWGNGKFITQKNKAFALAQT